MLTIVHLTIEACLVADLSNLFAAIEVAGVDITPEEALKRASGQGGDISSNSGGGSGGSGSISDQVKQAWAVVQERKIEDVLDDYDFYEFLDVRSLAEFEARCASLHLIPVYMNLVLTRAVSQR